MSFRGRFTLLPAFLLLASFVACQGGSSTLTPQPVVRPTVVPPASPSASASATPIATATASASPTPSASPVPSPIATATLTPGPTPTATPTVNPQATPTIASISPTSGAVGSMVTITGVGFTEATDILFTGNVPSYTNFVYGDDTLVVMVPMGALNGPITVKTTNGTAVSSMAFTVTP